MWFRPCRTVSFLRGASLMKTTSFVSAAILAIAHGLTASALIISSSNFERTGASLEPLSVAGNETADSADQNRPEEKQSPSTGNKLDTGKDTITPE